MPDLIGILEKYVLEIIAAILTAAFGAHLVRRTNRKDRYAAACGKFRAAVLNALSGLYPIPSEWPRESDAILQVLKQRFTALQIAVQDFRPHVPLLKQWFFDRAWRLYYLGRDGREIDGQNYWQYVPHRGSGIAKGRSFIHDNTLTYKDDFKKNVDRLLKYAKST